MWVTRWVCHSILSVQQYVPCDTIFEATSDWCINQTVVFEISLDLYGTTPPLHLPRPHPNPHPPPPPQNPSTPWDSTCCHWTRCLINFPYYSSQANTKLGVYFPLNLLSVFQFVNKLSLLFILLHFTLVVVVSFFGVCGFNNNPMV